jgi:hypothetical protein
MEGLGKADGGFGVGTPARRRIKERGEHDTRDLSIVG